MKSNTTFSFQALSLKRRSSASGAIMGSAGSPRETPGRVLPQAEIVAPQRHLRLHQARRIGHHARRHLEEGVADIERVAHADAIAVGIGPARQKSGHHALALLGDAGERARPFDRIGKFDVGFRLGARRRRGLARIAAPGRRLGRRLRGGVDERFGRRLIGGFGGRFEGRLGAGFGGRLGDRAILGRRHGGGRGIDRPIDGALTHRRGLRVGAVGRGAGRR